MVRVRPVPGGDSLGALAALASLATFASLASGSAVIPRHESLSFRGPLTVEAAGMANIHVTYNLPINGQLSMHYGDCSAPLSHPKDLHHHQIGETAVGSHPAAERHALWADSRPERFVWLVPADAPDGQCLHAYSGEDLIGRSEAVTVTKRTARRSVAFADITDAEGPWFDGVAYLQEKEPDAVFVAQAKAKTVGVIGGGMAGLMSTLLLNSVGIYNWKLIEGSGRLGGRVHTTYMDNTSPDQYQYQELGPMRFPVSITYDDTNETVPLNDQKMVFQLVDSLNKMNGNASKYKINWIPWIQDSPNVPYPTSKRLPDGTVPGAAMVAENPALADDPTLTYSNATAVAEAQAAYDAFLHLDRATINAMALDMFRMHKKAVAEGIFDFSEAGYLRYKIGTDLNVTDQVFDFGENFDSWAYDNVYFSATEWRTVDQGVNRVPDAFWPLVKNRTILNTVVQEMSFSETSQKVTVKWRPDPFKVQPKTMDFDYVIVAVPFSRVRLWRLPNYTSLLSRAINTLYYEQSCKVALRYKTRFWEHLDRPILGGCGDVDIPGIGSVCYPSYHINATGPGVLLASYSSGIPSRSVGSLKDKDHAALVHRAMIEIHGPIAEAQFTGDFDRMCWENNEFHSGAWVSPSANQQQLYLPAYFHTEKHTVFVGEHTSYVHAWVWSALESAVRGTAQLLLDMGLVDEAKAVTTEWMARWIHM